MRLGLNMTQALLAEIAGRNRWTISQTEKGQAINLMSLIQTLSALDAQHVLKSFEVENQISHLVYAKMTKATD